MALYAPSKPYDDDRPGMMRVHIAQQRGRALAECYTVSHLRALARRHGVAAGRRLGKVELATALAFAGVTAPDYDKGCER